MRATSFFPLVASLVAVVHGFPTRRDNPISPSFPYGSTKVRGVNLGGWLVLEVKSYLSIIFD
jgi:hypothetical protein